ncbi:MAG: hypothetical protein ACREPD_12005 [Stenotrophomonas sp.]|uniref:hypothetical protein n=1 Tax=Stenotrophomonas sp. TaxID=69392 RepID=UPI003D6D88BF
MLIKVMTWALVVMAAFFAAVGAAPFSAGALFPVCSLPLAAFAAWRGLIVAPLLVLGWGAVGFWAAVIPLDELFDGWALSAWLAAWTGVLLVGVVRSTVTAPGARASR